MIDVKRIAAAQLQSEPYQWAAIDRLFSPEDTSALAATFPADHFKRLSDYDGPKEFDYEVRCLIRMGEQSISRAGSISEPWRALANEFLSPGYRSALASLTGLDLTGSPLEVNVFRYPPGASHGAHPDHRNKLVTHVIYFNESWEEEDGGSLKILRSSDLEDVAMSVPPLAGNSAVLVRSDSSWHAVSRVDRNRGISRHSLTATFYRPGCVSSVWPSRSQLLFHDYPVRLWDRLKRTFLTP